jgi:hypothetical protein
VDHGDKLLPSKPTLWEWCHRPSAPNLVEGVTMFDESMRSDSSLIRTADRESEIKAEEKCVAFFL